MARNVRRKSGTPALPAGGDFRRPANAGKRAGHSRRLYGGSNQAGLINAYRKDREDHREVPAENVEVELTEAVMSMVQQRTVVEGRWRTLAS